MPRGIEDATRALELLELTPRDQFPLRSAEIRLTLSELQVLTGNLDHAVRNAESPIEDYRRHHEPGDEPSDLRLARALCRQAVEPRFQSEGAANAVLTAVCEFLRFGAAHGWVPVELVTVLSEPKFLKHLPPGYDAGEFGQFRTVQARTLRFRVAEPGVETLTDQQISQMIALTRLARDQFLIMLLACTCRALSPAMPPTPSPARRPTKTTSGRPCPSPSSPSSTHTWMRWAVTSAAMAT